MIVFEDVYKTYPGSGTALDGVSFRVERGEMVFVTGHSGAGKSTLLRLVALMDRSSRGHVIVDGQSLERIRRRDLPYYRRKIGFIFQDHRLLPDRTVFDNVALPLVVAGARREEVTRRVNAALDKVGLLDRARNLPVTLSSGEQQRVGIARAVVARPPILLADEPTGNLDPDLSLEIMELFTEFNRVGVSVVVATHDLGIVEQLGHRRVVLEGGRVVEDARAA